MVTLDLARRLEDAGVRWVPGDGDRFMVPDSDLDDDLYCREPHGRRGGRLISRSVLKFNGTTEWALDIVQSG